ncbi:MAG: PAS domain-containing sensor histidine kinase [bacterium]|nr:MAG: PAS domain-containing sensor histidine kinase [bacterium]
MDPAVLQRIFFQFRDLQSASVAACVVNHEGRILYFNPAMESLFGYTSDEYLGQSVSMLHPESEAGNWSISQALGEGSGCWQGEIPARARDGRNFTCQITATRFTDEEGLPILTLGIVRDMTDYRAMEILKSQNDRLGALAGIAGRVATYTDTKKLAREALQALTDLLPVKAGTILLLDPATGELRLHESINIPSEINEALSRQGWNNLIEGEVVRDRVPVLIDDMSRSERVVTRSPEFLSLAVIPLISQDRVIGTMTVASGPPYVFNQADMEFLFALGSHVGIYLDNARLYQELEKRNRELRSQNMDLEELLSILSHDLRNPLATIGGYASLLMKKGESASLQERNQFAKVILSKTKETTKRLSDMLTFFRASLASPENSRERVDVRDVIAQSLEEATPEEFLEDVSVALPDHLPVLLGNRNQLIHLFTNLLSNAFKFRDPGRRLSIVIEYRTMEKGAEIHQCFTVSDNGTGIPSGRIDHIFKLFNRGGSREDIPGTGVGLAVVERIVKKNRGEIDVRSKRGQGSSFTFTLPWLEVEEEKSV